MRKDGDGGRTEGIASERRDRAWSIRCVGIRAGWRWVAMVMKLVLMEMLLLLLLVVVGRMRIRVRKYGKHVHLRRIWLVDRREMRMMYGEVICLLRRKGGRRRMISVMSSHV